MKGARGALVGAVAALVASAGDLGLLWAANTGRPDLELRAPPDWVLPAATWAGVVAIPFYTAGYRQIAGALAASAPRAARSVLAFGAAGAALGALVHGITGHLIAAGPGRGLVGIDPLAGVAQAGGWLLPLWSALAVIGLVASTRFAVPVANGHSPLPRWMSLANPALLTVVFALAARSPWGRAFVVPAAPNLAHVVFFALSAAALGTGRASRGCRR